MQGLGIYIGVNLIMTILIVASMDTIHRKIPKNRKILFLFIGYIIYIIFSVYRSAEYGIAGIDSYNYRRIFEMADINFKEFFLLRREEALYKVSVWIFRQISDDYRLLLFFFHTIIYVGFVAFFMKWKVEKKYLMNYFTVYLICGYMIEAFCLQRTIIAMVICLFVIIELEKEDYKKALVLSVVSTLIHSSAIVYIVTVLIIWFLKKKQVCELRRRIMWIIGFIILEVPFAYIGSLLVYSSSKYSTYKNNADLAINTYLFVFVITLIMVYRLRKKPNSIYYSIDIDLLFCTLLCLPVQLVLAIAYRMVLLYMPILYKCLNYSYIEFRKSKDGRLQIENLLMLVLIWGYIIYRIYTLYTSEFVSYGMYPYEFVF